MLIYPNDIAPEKLPEITIISALSVADAVEKAVPKEAGDVRIKWPNDVLLNQKKLSGILTELCFLPSGEKYVVVGIGVNVFQKSFPDEISETATSLLIETKAPEGSFSKKEIIEDIWEGFSYYYKIFQKTGDLSGMKEKYESLLINTGKIVKVLDPKGEYEAKALGIDERGRLMIEKDDGISFIDSGEVSIRGILGYV